MSTTFTGLVHGNAIILDQNPGLPDGTRVLVVVQARRSGAVTDGTDPNPMSSQRRMSPEERAELERVYQDRGCGVECDP